MYKINSMKAGEGKEAKYVETNLKIQSDFGNFVTAGFVLSGSIRDGGSPGD